MFALADIKILALVTLPLVVTDCNVSVDVLPPLAVNCNCEPFHLTNTPLPVTLI